MSVFCEAAELPSNLKTVTKMENKTGLEKLLDSLVHQSIGCGQSSERYILSGIIEYTKKLIEEEKVINDDIRKSICTCILNKSGLVIEKCLNH